MSSELERKERLKKIYPNGVEKTKNIPSESVEQELQYFKFQNDSEEELENNENLKKVSKYVRDNAKKNNKNKTEIQKSKLTKKFISKKQLLEATILLLIAIFAAIGLKTTIDSIEKQAIEWINEKQSIDEGINKIVNHYHYILNQEEYSVAPMDQAWSIYNEKTCQKISLDQYMGEIIFNAKEAGMTKAELYILIKEKYDESLAQIICGKISNEELNEAAENANKILPELIVIKGAR